MLQRLSGIKLSQKGLILLALPLLFQLFVYAALSFLLINSQKETQRVERIRAFIASANDILQGLYQCGSLLFAYGLTRSASIEQQFDSTLTDITRKEGLLWYELKADRAWSTDAARAQVLCGQLVEQIRLVKEAIDETETTEFISNMDSSILKARVDPLLKEFMLYIKRIVESRNRTLQSELLAQQRSRQQLNLLIAAAMVLNVVIVVLLWHAFNLSTNRRLDVLIDNSGRVVRGESLNKPLDGVDEISTVDRSFHSMVVLLEEAARKEKEVERLKQEFMAMVSHDLKSPLTSIGYGLALLEDGMVGELSSDARDIVSRANKSVSRLMRLVNDLLSIERAEAGRLELRIQSVASDELLQRAVEDCAELAEESRVEVVALPSSCVVQADEDRLVQVLINLLSNAIKFSAPGQSVHLSAEPSGDTSEVMFCVRDSGRGIPADKLDVVFERFKQVEHRDTTEKGGTGLGLPICKAIVEQHNGRIWAESELGAGSRFYFSLPGERADC